MTFCRFYRTLASLWLEDHNHLPAFIRSHVRDCPACREHLARESELAGELRAAAAIGREPLPPFFPARLRSRLREEGEGGTGGLICARAWRPFAWAGVTVPAVLLVAIVFLRSPESTPEPSVALPTVEWSGTLPLPAGESWVQWGQRLEQPLDREIHSALEDGRDALIVLVQNFVPEQNVAAVTEKANGLFPEWSVPTTAQP
jgi:hypothetical protein